MLNFRHHKWPTNKYPINKCTTLAVYVSFLSKKKKKKRRLTTKEINVEYLCDICRNCNAHHCLRQSWHHSTWCPSISIYILENEIVNRKDARREHKTEVSKKEFKPNRRVKWSSIKRNGFNALMTVNDIIRSFKLAFCSYRLRRRQQQRLTLFINFHNSLLLCTAGR